MDLKNTFIKWFVIGLAVTLGVAVGYIIYTMATWAILGLVSLIH